MAESTPHTPTGSTTNPVNPSTPPATTKPRNPSTPVAHKISGVTIPAWSLYEQNPNHRGELRGMTATEVESRIAEIAVEHFFDTFLKPHNPENSSEEIAIKSIVDGLEVNKRLKVAGGKEPERYPHLIALIQAAWKDTDLLARNVSFWGERKKFRITTDIAAYKRHPNANGRDVTKYDIPEFVQPPVPVQVDENIADTEDNVPEEETTPVAEAGLEEVSSTVADASAKDAVPTDNSKPVKLPPYAAKMSYSDAEIFLEDKTDVATAALHKNPDKPFLLDGEIHKTALGQIGEYAVEIMRRQHRKFLFSILTVANTIRFVRWDRCGIIATEPIDFVKDLTTFIKFFYRFGHMSDADRGMDETVIKASPEDERVLETFKAEQLPSLVKSHKEMFKEAFDLEGIEEQDWPLVKIEVKKLEDTDSDSEPVRAPHSSENTDVDSSTSSSPRGPSSKPIRLLIRYPRVSPRSPFGRSTKGFVALDMDEMKLKFLKDCWRYDDERYHPELEVYKRLQAANVENIAKVDGGGDVVDAQGVPQVTAAHEYISVLETEYLALVHYRLLIRQLGTPLKEYCNSRMLCYYILLALLGHEGAFKAGVLHRDVSPNNIMIDEAPENIGEEAFLLDWDLCRYVDELDDGPTQKNRSGTWAFISSLLLKYPSKQHELADDLESFVHILHWFCLRFHAHDLTVYQLSTILTSVYFEAHPQGGYDQGGDNKLKIMKDGKPPFQLDEDKVDPGLIKIVNTVSSLCSEHYATVNFSELEASSAKLLKQDEEKPQEPMPTINEEETMKRATSILQAAFGLSKLAPRPCNPEVKDVNENSVDNGGNSRRKRKNGGRDESDPKPISPFTTHDRLIAVFQKVGADVNSWQDSHSDKIPDQFNIIVHKSIKVAPTSPAPDTKVSTNGNSTIKVKATSNSDQARPLKRSRTNPNVLASVKALGASTAGVDPQSSRSRGHGTSHKSRSGTRGRKTKAGSGTSGRKKVD
ncbi:hypothetical protein C8Q75DRAFT_731483 [Abortiporus biennis]|nr:hypothetical protein C8Q75DRAFT_731483 [Abortiporus biennis]